MCAALVSVSVHVHAYSSDMLQPPSCHHLFQASPLGHTTSSSSFVHPQFAQLAEHPRQSFIYTPPEQGRQMAVPPVQSRPRDQDRRPGENGGVPRGPGQPQPEGPKMVRGEREREREGGGWRRERQILSIKRFFALLLGMYWLIVHFLLVLVFIDIFHNKGIWTIHN